jgi:GST-like protein
MLGQTGHFFNQAPEKIPYAIQRFSDESLRIVGVLEQGLTGREYLAGDYSIADIACYPWVIPERQAQDIDEFPHLKRWKADIRARPAVQRAYEIAKTINLKPAVNDDEARRVLFGQSKDTVK